MKALVVTRDMAAGRAAIPVAKALKDWGALIFLAAEGKSIAEWKKAGFTLDAEGDEKELTLFEKSSNILWEDINADVIIVGLSSPINWEEEAALFVNENRIPLVFLEDIWGGHTRSKAVPNLVLTIDEMAVCMVEEHYPDARTLVVGNATVADIAAHPPSEEVQERVHQIRKGYGDIVLLAGQGSYTHDIIRVTLGCIKKRRGGEVLFIPRFHPKFKGTPEYDQWEALVAVADAANQPILEMLLDISTDHLAACADFTFSVFGTPLLVSDRYGKVPVSVQTEATIAGMKKSTGLDFYPPARGLAVLTVKSAETLDALSSDASDPLVRIAQERYTKVIQYPTEKVVAAIERIAGKK